MCGIFSSLFGILSHPHQPQPFRFTMIESKYDDPSPESKQEEEEKSEGASFLSPLVAAFAEFATSQAFGSDLHNFELENSSTFNGAELDGEQNLEWTDIFNSYVMLIEGKMEEFCEEHGSSAEQLFKEISEVNDVRSGGRSEPRSIF